MGWAEIEALESGRSALDLSSWRKTWVGGSDAVRWLDDLVTARVEDLGPNEIRRTLLLSRTGHLRADIHVLQHEDPDGGAGLLLIQDDVQPRSVADLLAPYVLSSDVEMSDRTRTFGLTASLAGLPTAVGQLRWPGGDDRLDALLPERSGAEADYTGVVSGDDVETWRIDRGIPRFGVDLDEQALPGEGGLDWLVDPTKGCFLGQESVAKIRNLGTTPWTYTALRSDIPVAPGTAVMAGDEEAGEIRSAALARHGGTASIARIRTRFREAALTTSSGVALRPA